MLACKCYEMRIILQNKVYTNAIHILVYILRKLVIMVIIKKNTCKNHVMCKHHPIISNNRGLTLKKQLFPIPM